MKILWNNLKYLFNKDITKNNCLIKESEKDIIENNNYLNKSIIEIDPLLKQALSNSLDSISRQLLFGIEKIERKEPSFNPDLEPDCNIVNITHEIKWLINLLEINSSYQEAFLKKYEEMRTSEYIFAQMKKQNKIQDKDSL